MTASEGPVLRVLCIGECMAELSPADRPGEYRLGFAGDTFNTAWYLKRLQPDFAVSYLTAIGTDAMSDRMVAEAQAAGIDTRLIRRDPDRSMGLYLIALDGGERSFTYWRSASAARRLARNPARLNAAMAEADLIYLSGITLAILEGAGRDRLFAALARARAAGKRIAFDPNLRPGLWTAPRDMTETVTRAAGLCDLAFPSYEDESHHFGDASPEATRDRYAAAGAQVVVVKNGPGPVTYCERNAAGEVQVTPAAALVDTTAAGDSFNAAFLATDMAGRPIADRIAQAAGIAAQVIGQNGALVPVTPLRL